MHIELSEAQIEVRDWAKSLAERLIAPYAVANSHSKISTDLLKALSAEGVMTLTVPEEKGGLGCDAVSFSCVIEEIAKVCASTGVSVAVTNMIADILVREASTAQQEKYLSQLISGKSLTASFCLTENSAGSDAKGLKATATRQGDHYILNGEKIYITNGAFSQFFLVMARTGPEKISAFLVDRDSPGLVIGKEEEKMGLEGSSTIRITLDQAKVPAENLVRDEGEGLKIALRALDGGRVSVSSQALGIGKASLAYGIRYAKEREAFGKHLSDFQAIQWKIANASTQLSAAELLVRRAAWLKDRKRSFSREASMAKLFTTEAAVQVCEDMIQILGGYGYIKEYPVERYYRDVRVTTLYEGTSEIQRLVIARDLLKKGMTS